MRLYCAAELQDMTMWMGDDARSFVKQRGLTVVTDFGYGELGTRYLPKESNLPTRSVNRICTAAVP
jgi:hypothetical protein